MRFFINKYIDRQTPKKSSVFHSSPYHKFFEGYVETKVPRENGNGTKILRVYRGTYYSQDLTHTRWKYNRILLAVLYTGAAALCVLSAWFATNGSLARYRDVFLSLSVIGLFWTLYILIFYLVVPRNMTVGCYRATSKPLVTAARTTAAVLGVSAVLQGFDAFIQTDGTVLNGLLCFAGFALAGVMILGIALLESRINYTRTRPKYEPGEDGVEIRR